MSEIIYLSNVRLSFPHIAEPQRTRNEQTGAERVSYNGDFVMPPDHPGFAQFMQRYGQMAMEKWKEHAQAVMNLIQGDRKTRCYGRGEEKVSKKTFQPYDGYMGMVFISAGRDTPPQIIQGDGTPVDPVNTMAVQALARKLYGGCRVNVAVKPWLQENKHGRGIRCDLLAIQFAGDDKPFGEAAPDVSNVFGAVATQAGAPVAAAPVMPLPPFMMGQ
jgi:hypothetical protein